MQETMASKTEATQHAEPSVGAQVETVSRDMKKLGSIAGHNAKRKMIEMKNRGEELCDRARSSTRHALEHRPWTVLAAAVGVGALAGLLLTRK